MTLERSWVAWRHLPCNRPPLQANTLISAIKKDDHLVVFLLGGEGGIRTLESFYTLPVFKTGTFNHSVTSP